MTRVLVAADSPVVRAGLDALIAAQPFLTIVGSIRTRDALSGRIRSDSCDVAVVELEPGEEPTALRTVSSSAASPALVLLGDDGVAAWAGDALRAGARAVLPRSASAEEIVAAIEAAASGLVVVPVEAADAVFGSHRRSDRGSPAERAPALTQRELEILDMIAGGLGNKVIAPRLGISEHTVKFHIASIFAKLHVSSRAEAVAVGGRLGLILL